MRVNLFYAGLVAWNLVAFLLHANGATTVIDGRTYGVRISTRF